MVVKSKQHFFRSLDLNSVIQQADSRDGAFTGTKLVCSLGPSSHTVPVLEAMLNAGMVAARIDLTWGGPEFHIRTLEALGTAMKRTKKLCAIILDTLGREMMVRRPCAIGEDGWPTHPEPMEIVAGQIITLTTRDDAESTTDVWPMTYPHLHTLVEVGDTIYIGRYLVTGSDQASLYLEVQEVVGQDIICQAQNGAVMDGLMTVYHMERSADSLSNLQNNLPLLSDYDKQTIALISSQFEVDFINVAYTRTREDVHEARLFLDSLGMLNTKVLAKIETRQALLNFRGILATADGIVLSRGHMGLDVAPEKMALVQKHVVSNCNLLGKPVLITRVMDSMVSNPRPTRAEATDIANAVLDGVDGILLGAETLRGPYPVEAVSTVAHICRCAEDVFDHTSHYDYLMTAAAEMEAVVQAAAEARSDVGMSKPHVAFALGQDFDAEDHIGSDNVSPNDSSNDLAGLGPTGRKGAGSFTNLRGMMHSGSLASLQAAYQEVHNFTAFGGAGNKSMGAGLSALGRGTSGGGAGRGGMKEQLPFMSVLESLASTAVRVAGKVQADLIVVYTATGRTAQLVAKYRPPMPILTLVVPRLINDGVRWRLEGTSIARSCQLTRGLLPMLATPGPNGDAVLEAAIIQAAAAGLVAPRGHVVVLQQIHDDFCVKVLTLDATGTHIVGSRSGPAVAAQMPRKTQKSSSGALAGSDDEADESEMTRSSGSFGVSPSIVIRGDAAKRVSAEVQRRARAPMLKTDSANMDSCDESAPTGSSKPGSPDTPMKRGSVDQQLPSLAEA
eukprot:GHUV01008513.1.p1 GENE.GHUV01008513.1~~GHUV01008513.1.p1  ORF type:complete len:786 (+),score=206.32 GHUV01008513.1:278-2635(+)